VTVTERVDVERLRRMLSMLERLKPEERTRFARYAEKLIQGGGEHEVKYFLKDYRYGRLYPHEDCLQGFKREVRSTLVRDAMIDIDGANMHPTVLMSIARENGWPCEALAHYLANREAVLASIPLERKLAKQLMLSQMYGGLVRNIIRHMIDKGQLVGRAEEWSAKVPQFVHRFGAEVRQMASHVPEAFPELNEAAINSAKRDSNLPARALSILVQSREIEATVAAIEFVKKRGWELAVIMHDGFMMYRRADAKVDRAMLNGIRQMVKEKTRMDIDFEVKEFEEPYF
jgi:hypothetical protein